MARKGTIGHGNSSNSSSNNNSNSSAGQISSSSHLHITTIWARETKPPTMGSAWQHFQCLITQLINGVYVSLCSGNAATDRIAFGNATPVTRPTHRNWDTHREFDTISRNSTTTTTIKKNKKINNRCRFLRWM